MAEDSKSFHGKDLQAMTLNMKEQRVLKKKLQTLELEEMFSIKTLNLNKKQIKVFQKRLCSNVGKIRSHLKPEDIETMKQLESDGKFIPPLNPVSISHSGTIKSAHKRLKLLTNEEILEITHGNLRKPANVEEFINGASPKHERKPVKQKSGELKSTFPQATEITIKPLTDKSVIKINDNEQKNFNLSTSAKYRQSNPLEFENNDDSKIPVSFSVSSENVNKLIEETPGSDLDCAEQKVQFNKETDNTTNKFHSLNNSLQNMSEIKTETLNYNNTPIKRPTTTGGLFTSRSSRLRPPSRPKTSLGTESSQSLNYSSHKTSQSRNETGRRSSLQSNSSLSGEIAKERALEFRKGLLYGENIRNQSIEDKRQTFLSRIGKWVEENPSIVDNRTSKFNLIEAKDLDIFKPDPNNLAVANEGLYDEKESDSWKDLKKCRYLRVKDDVIDLSGINTLAKDNMQFFTGFKINYDIPTKKVAASANASKN